MKHFSCHNCFCEIYLLSLYLKYVVPEKLTYYDFAYYLCSRQGVEDPSSVQVEADGVYLNKVYNWPMTLAPMNGESGDMCEKPLREQKKVRPLKA